MALAGGLGGWGGPLYGGAGVRMVRRGQGVVVGRIIYFRKALINAVRAAVLVACDWDPFASGEGWKVYLAEDLGILALADFFFFLSETPREHLSSRTPSAQRHIFAAFFSDARNENG